LLSATQAGTTSHKCYSSGSATATLPAHWVGVASTALASRRMDRWALQVSHETKVEACGAIGVEAGRALLLFAGIGHACKAIGSTLSCV
jgi:hypothetical protein